MTSARLVRSHGYLVPTGMAANSVATGMAGSPVTIGMARLRQLELAESASVLVEDQDTYDLSSIR